MKGNRVVDQVRFRGVTLTDGEKDLKIDYGRAFLGSVIQLLGGFTTMWFILNTFPGRDPRIPVNIADPKIMPEYVPQLLLGGAFIFVMNIGAKIVKSSFRSVKVKVESDNLHFGERLQKFVLRSISNAVVGVFMLNLATAFMDKFSPDVKNAFDTIQMYSSFHKHFYEVIADFSNGYKLTNFIVIQSVLVGLALGVSKMANDIKSDR